MGRPTEGFKVAWKRGWAYARFTWQKHEYFIALWTRDKREAEEAAARAYSEVVSGARRPLARQPGKLLDLADLLDSWIESKRSSVDPDTLSTLDVYARSYVHCFGSLDRITEASGSSYGLTRLGKALRKTVLRELSYLRQFLAWCKLHGVIAHVPIIPKLPPKATGVRSGTQRAKPVEITPAEAAAIIALLPEESKTINGRKWPVRARFAFMWETALRPETISRLTVHDQWRPGAKHLELANEDDKARYGRTVDLTPEAVRLLTRVAPKSGLIFGGSCFYRVLKAAAARVLGAVRGKSFAPYDFRHARAKERLDAGAPIRGVSYMLGHKQVSTTDKYLAPDRAAGARALDAGLVSVPFPYPTKSKTKRGLRSA